MKQTTCYSMPSKQKFGAPFRMMQTRGQLKRAFSVAENTQPEIMDEQYSPSVDMALPNLHQLQPSQEEARSNQEPSPRRQLKHAKTVYESTQPETDEQYPPSMDLFSSKCHQPSDRGSPHSGSSYFRAPLNHATTLSESEHSQPHIDELYAQYSENFPERGHLLSPDERDTQVPQMPYHRGWLKQTKTISESEVTHPSVNEQQIQHLLNKEPPYGL